MREDLPPLDWIRPLAEPYLRGLRPILERSAGLEGYRFARATAKGRGKPTRKRIGRESTTQVGFFVGYLTQPGHFVFLSPQPPECLVFAFVEPVGAALHRRLVGRPESLLRQTFTYIRWLTHRPPRFEFYEAERAAMVRHVSMCEWPASRREHFSRNFFIETLAWLVRSGLVRKFRTEPLDGPTLGSTSKPRKDCLSS